MRYQHLEALLRLFSRDGMFFDYSTEKLLTDPVYIAEHPHQEYRTRIFSRAHLAGKFAEVDEHATRYAQLSDEMDDLQARANLLQVNNFIRRRESVASQGAIAQELADLELQITQAAAELSELEALLRLPEEVLANPNQNYNNDPNLNSNSNSAHLLQSGKALCPITKMVIDNSQIRCALFFQNLCALLVHRIIVCCDAEIVKSCFIGNENIDKQILQGYELLIKYVANLDVAVQQQANMVINKILLSEFIAADILPPIFVNYINKIIDCIEGEKNNLLINETINLHPDDVAKLRRSKRRRVEQDQDITEHEITLGEQEQHDSSQCYTNAAQLSFPPVSAEKPSIPQQTPLSIVNLTTKLHCSISSDIANSRRFMTPGIVSVQPYSGLQIPNVPVVLPYDPITDIDYDDILDEIVIFPLTHRFKLENASQLPLQIRVAFARLNVNVFSQVEDISCFVSVQSKPDDWEERCEQLYLRPHPWLHANIQPEDELVYSSTCVAAIASLGSKFAAPAMVEGIFTHKTNKGDLVFSNRQLAIKTLAQKVSNSFYSICMEYDVATGLFKRVAITLHCLLVTEDLESLNLAIGLAQSFCESMDQLSISNLLDALDLTFTENNHNIPTNEIRNFISANWHNCELIENTDLTLIEQEVNTHKSILAAKVVNYLVGRNESAIAQLSVEQNELILTVKKHYHEKYVNMGGALAVLDNFKRYLKQKIAEQDPGLVLEITHENIADINAKISEKYKITDVENKTNDELNYAYVQYLQRSEPETFKRYLKPHIVALRYLSSRNYFMHPQAEYQVQEEIISAAGNYRINRAYRSTISDEAKEVLAYFWLAASDQNAVPTDPNFTVASRIEAFVEGIWHLARAHNFDANPDYEEYYDENEDEENENTHYACDNGGLDRPTCTSGIRSRLTLSLFAHPILDDQESVNILQDIRWRWVEFVTNYFKQFINIYYTAKLQEIYQKAYYCWANAVLIDDNETWDEIFAALPKSLQYTGKDEVIKFVLEFQEIIKRALELFNIESSKKYGAKLAQQPKASEIEKCVEFGVPKFNIAKITFSSYEQYIRLISQMFWCGKPNANGVWLNKAIAYFLDSRFTGLVNARCDQLKKINQGDILQQTALHRACRVGDKETIKKMLDLEIDFNILDIYGKKALDYIYTGAFTEKEVSEIEEIFKAAISCREHAFGKLLGSVCQDNSNSARSAVIRPYVTMANDRAIFPAAPLFTFNEDASQLISMPDTEMLEILETPDTPETQAMEERSTNDSTNNGTNNRGYFANYGDINNFATHLHAIYMLIRMFRRSINNLHNNRNRHYVMLNQLIINMRTLAREIRELAVRYNFANIITCLDQVIDDRYCNNMVSEVHSPLRIHLSSEQIAAETQDFLLDIPMVESENSSDTEYTDSLDTVASMVVRNDLADSVISSDYARQRSEQSINNMEQRLTILARDIQIEINILRRGVDNFLTSEAEVGSYAQNQPTVGAELGSHNQPQLRQVTVLPPMLSFSARRRNAISTEQEQEVVRTVSANVSDNNSANNPEGSTGSGDVEPRVANNASSSSRRRNIP